VFIPLLPLKIKWPKNVLNWRKEIEEFPAVASELSDYCPKIEDWLITPRH
jgi:hypothetical protein